MAAYSGTRRAVYIGELYTSVRVSKKARNNFRESTHTIGKTRLMQIIVPSSF